MKIYVVGSNAFKKEMVQAKDDMVAMGLDGWIHPDYEAFVKGTKPDLLTELSDSIEHANFKRDNDYLRVHYKHILESDAILVVNLEKNGIPNYIGGNVLIEMGQAYVNDKQIFLLHDMPTDALPYLAEIECMDPVLLHGNLENIKQHIPALA